MNEHTRKQQRVVVSLERLEDDRPVHRADESERMLNSGGFFSRRVLETGEHFEHPRES